MYLTVKNSTIFNTECNLLKFLLNVIGQIKRHNTVNNFLQIKYTYVNYFSSYVFNDESCLRICQSQLADEEIKMQKNYKQSSWLQNIVQNKYQCVTNLSFFWDSDLVQTILQS